MDISEFLASMQGSASDRALARNTRQATPDADNDPRTKDAAPASDLMETERGFNDINSGQGGYDEAQMYGNQQAIADDEQTFEGGGEVEGDEGGGDYVYKDDARYSALPESQDTGAGDYVYKDDARYSALPESQDTGAGDRLPAAEGEDQDRLVSMGGERINRGNIEDRRDQHGEGTTFKKDGPHSQDEIRIGNQSNDASLDEGTVRKQKGRAGMLGAQQRFADGGEVDPEQGAIPDDEVTGPVKNTQQPEDESWRDDAMEGITAGLDYGRNVLHAVNRPMDDGALEGDVEKYLKGEGAMDPKQFQAAQQAVDPDGTMDPASRLQKTLGSLYKFYTDKFGADSTEPHAPASKAVWSALQYARKAYNAYAAHATVADDRGDGEGAAQSATGALNQVPDGLLADVKFVDGKYVTTFVDPETGKRIDQKDLSPEQLKHVLAHGFDRLIEKGTPGGVSAAANQTEGHQRIGKPRVQILERVGEPPAGEGGMKVRQRLEGGGADPTRSYGGGNAAVADFSAPDPGRPVRPSNQGLPPNMDTSGMSVNDISELRRKYAAGQVENAGRERVAEITARGRGDVAEQNNKTKAEIAAEREKGLNSRTGLAPGQIEATNRSILARAQADTKQWLETQRQRPPQEQIDAFTRDRMAYWREQAGRQQQQQRAPQQQQEQPPTQTQPQQPGQTGAPPQTLQRNGHEYRFDPQRNGYVLVR